MAVDHIRYDILAQSALRGVVRTVLADAAKKGLPGEHHFKITFNTTAPGVRLSERMRMRYPQDMTIVLQHQFWDLKVTEESSRSASHSAASPNGFSCRSTPSSRFTIRRWNSAFSSRLSKAARPADAGAGKPEPEKPARAADPARQTEPAKADAPPPQPAPGADSGGGEVVRLDRFRKK